MNKFKTSMSNIKSITYDDLKKWNFHGVASQIPLSMMIILIFNLFNWIVSAFSYLHFLILPLDFDINIEKPVLSNHYKVSRLL